MAKCIPDITVATSVANENLLRARKFVTSLSFYTFNAIETPVICVYVCMCVCPLITAASHIGITKQGYKPVHRNTGIVLNFADFPKNASFKSYGVIWLPRAAPASYSFFHHEISFYASVKPIATFSLHRQRACGRQRAIRWYRLVKRHGYTDHEY